MRYLFAPFLVALSFLTLLPVGVANPTDAEISRSRGLVSLRGPALWAATPGHGVCCGPWRWGSLFFIPALAALLLVTQWRWATGSFTWTA